MHEVPTFGKELKRLKDQVHAKKKKKKDISFMDGHQRKIPYI